MILNKDLLLSTKFYFYSFKDLELSRIALSTTCKVKPLLIFLLSNVDFDISNIKSLKVLYFLLKTEAKKFKAI